MMFRMPQVLPLPFPARVETLWKAGGMTLDQVKTARRNEAAELYKRPFVCGDS